MGKDNSSEYNSMVNTYNRLVARYKHLQTQIEDKERAWAELEKQYKTNEQKARKLCEMILAKDKNSQFLGQAYSYSFFSTSDLIDKARVAYEKYNSSRTELLKSIQQAAEQRRLDYENLMTQYEMLQRSKGATANNEGNNEEKGKSVQEPSQADSPPAAAAPPAAFSPPSDAPKEKPVVPPSVDYSIQKAAQNNKVDVVLLEEDEDVSIADVEHLSEMRTMNTAIQLEKSGLKTRQSQKVKKKLKEVEETVKGSVMIPVEDIMKNLNGRCHYMIKVIGSTGISDTPSLKEEMKKRRDAGEADALSDSQIPVIYKSLVDNQVLCFEKITLPLKGNLILFWLSPTGGVIYKNLVGEDPKEAQCLEVRRSHDNFIHGYGIMALKDVLEKCGLYTSVCAEKSKNTITVRDGAKYIPDIIAVGKAASGKPFKAYFEYEMNTHHQSDFNVKMNKMATVTKFLNIVVPNREVLKDISSKIETWIESRGSSGRLPGYKVRVSTLPMLDKAENINSDDGWNLVYDLGQKGENAKKENKIDEKKKGGEENVGKTSRRVV